MSEKKYTIGVDVGGSHITCVAMDMQKKELVKDSMTRFGLSHTAQAKEIFSIWAKAINNCVSYVGVDNVVGIGFAVPGPFNYKEGISMMEHKYPNLYKLHIPTELKKYLVQDLPMRFLNDASAFAVGVSWVGKGKGYKKVVVITLGTGFGSAYIDKGIPMVYGDNLAPEGCFWHLPYKEDIADAYFSTRWFVDTYNQRTDKHIKGVKDLLALPEAQSLFDEFGNNLGEFLSPWLKKFDAEVLVMGGNISLAYNHFQKSFTEKLQKENCQVQVEVSQLMEDAAIVGATRLFEEDFWSKISENLPNI